MPKEWTGVLVGMMHNHRITNRMLANRIGCTEEWVSMVLNGKREPQGAEERFRQAVEELCRETTPQV